MSFRALLLTVCSLPLSLAAHAEEAPVLVQPAPSAAAAPAAEAPSSTLLSLSTDAAPKPGGDGGCARCDGHAGEERDLDHGGYGAPMWGMSVLGGAAMSTEGGRGAFLIDHRWAVGGYGFHARPAADGGDQRGGPEGGHHGGGHDRGGQREALSVSGVFVERVLLPEATVHPSVELSIGHGHLSMGNQRTDVMHTGAAARLELKAARWARVAAGVRVDGAIVPGSPSLLMMNGTGVGGDLMVKFGWF